MKPRSWRRRPGCSVTAAGAASDRVVDVPAGTPRRARAAPGRRSPAACGTPLGADSVANAVTDAPRKQLWVVMPISLR